MQIKKTLSLGQFAKAGEDFKDGDILQILDEGKEVEGDYGVRTVFQIRLPNGESKNLTFNRTSLNHLVDSYGEETRDWKGKEAKAWVLNQMVSGKMRRVVYLTAPDQTLEGME